MHFSMPSQVIKKDGFVFSHSPLVPPPSHLSRSYLKMMEMPVANRSAKLADALSRKQAINAAADAAALSSSAVEADSSSDAGVDPPVNDSDSSSDDDSAVGSSGSTRHALHAVPPALLCSL
jgi:hypothetical protein